MKVKTAAAARRVATKPTHTAPLGSPRDDGRAERCLLLAAYCEGDIRAQLVWQASCSLVQLLRQESLAVVLPVVAVDVPDAALPGTTHDDWQLAACELHVIMQLVVVEVCAR